jgi:hypothetical protein
LLGLVLLAAPPAAHAVGPTLPLEFEDESLEKDPWALTLFLDANQVADLKVERRLYRAGQQTARERIEVKPVRSPDQRREMAPLPLRFPGIERLPDGAFAQKIVVEARWASEPASVRPLRLERWVYFLVSKGRVRRLSMEEYSGLTDPAELGIGPDGRPAIIKRGGDVKLDVPLDRTRGRPAGVVGPSGGLVQERPADAPRTRPSAERDTSEQDEK